MAERGPVRLVEGRPRRLRLFQGGDRTRGPAVTLDEPPTIPPSGGSPAGHSTSLTQRLGARGADREFSSNAANACVQVSFGGTETGGIPTGAFLIGKWTTSNAYVYDWSFGEGELESISNIKFDDKPYTDFSGVTVEIHLGASGDTGSTIIEAIDPTYSAPDFIARVVVRVPRVGPNVGQFNPYSITAEVEGIHCYSTFLSDYAYTRNISIFAHEILHNTRWGAGNPDTNLVEWGTVRDYCDYEIETDYPRYHGGGRIDVQDTVENHVKFLLAHCDSHLKYVAGRFGVWTDTARDRATDTESQLFNFRDHGPNENMIREPGVAWKGRLERPTVVTIDYTDEDAEFVENSVQIPLDGPAPPLPWIEKRLRLSFLTTSKRTKIRAVREYNLEQTRNRDISLETFLIGFGVEPGDRIQCDSRLLIGATTTLANSGAIEGFEDLEVVDQNVSENGIVLRCHPYRDTTYGDDVTAPDPPEPPPGPDPQDPPECPTDLVALHADSSEYGHIEWTPSTSDNVISYRIYDNIPSTPEYRGTVLATEPLNGSGKHTFYSAALVHDDGGGNYVLDVTVIAVGDDGQVSTSCDSDSWTEAIEDAATDDQPSTSVGGVQTSIGDSASYSMANWTKIPVTLATHYHRWNSVVGHASGDFLILTSDNNPGILVVREAGFYHLSFGVRFDENNDSDFRAGGVIALQPVQSVGDPAFGHILGLKIDITSGGTGYAVDDVLNFTGGTSQANAIPIAAKVASVSGGVITSLNVTPGTGLGYSAVPSVSSVTSVSGTGATFSISLAAAITMTDIFGSSGAPTYGQLVLEDNRSGIASTTALPTASGGRDIYLRSGACLMLVAQQSSGGAENVHPGYDVLSAPECDMGMLTFMSLHGFRTNATPPALPTCIWELPG